MRTSLLLFLSVIGLVSSISAAPRPATQIRRTLRAHAPHFSGTILVARDGRTLFHESFGLASRQLDVRNANGTKYRIASITKLFTAVMALQLHEEGKLALDQPIGTYLPNCGGEPGAQVTVHQLLNHTSGLTEPVVITSKEDAIRNGIDLYQRPHSVEAFVAKYCGAPLATPAGNAFRYNNGDYILLGKLIETLEGQPFESVLRRRILQPVAMHDSGMLEQHRVVKGLASAYFTRDSGSDVLANDMPVYDENWFAAGAMYSTAADLRKFADALFGGRLLKPQTLTLLLKPGLDRYGYGTWIYHDTIGGKPFTSVMRPGQIMGTNTVLYRVVEAGLTLIVLSNTDQTNVDALAHELSKALLQ